MRIVPWKRSLAVVVLSASALVAVAGCTVARKTSVPATGAADAPPQKDYQWQDMSQGKEIFGDRSKATPVN